MIFRGRLDLGWRDFAFAATACLRSHNRAELEDRIRQAIASPEDAFICLSVRSGFDIFLQALALPAGSEILVSAITIPDMGRIIRAHDLVPVPVDVDPATLEPIPGSLEKALSPRTRAVLVAHLFGAQLSLDESRQFARDHDLHFLEDCAQAYAPGSYVGHPESDARMLSFGPIKTDTALGGGILFIRDRALLGRMRTLQRMQFLQTRWSYAQRVMKYALLQLLSFRPLFALFRGCSRLAGRTHDEVIGQAVRGFRGGELLRRIRQRPSGPQLAMLSRRLANPGLRRLALRTQAGNAFTRALPAGIKRPGSAALAHTHWIFPLLVSNPEELMCFLWDRGFDATRGTSSLGLVEAVPERPEVQPEMARELLAQLLFLPVYPEVPGPKREMLTQALAEFARRTP